MGFDVAALMSLFGLTGFFAAVGTVLACWMAWRIVEKAGFPGWTGLGGILLAVTGIASIVPLVLLWIFAFMRWPRDEPGRATVIGAPPRHCLAVRRHPEHCRRRRLPLPTVARGG